MHKYKITKLVRKKMDCDNCKNCFAKNFSPKLKMIFDYFNTANNVAFPLFEICGKESNSFFNNKNGKIRCFLKTYFKTIDWNKVEKYYKKNQKEIDKELGFDKE